ncbi:pentapeptide repeat-containing protein [Brunnivagina elsteri]|nr:pentapeptide repeat-containing protein [Calothrix elsteri]
MQNRSFPGLELNHANFSGANLVNAQFDSNFNRKKVDFTDAISGIYTENS